MLACFSAVAPLFRIKLHEQKHPVSRSECPHMHAGEALEHQSRSRVSTGNHPAISSGPRTTGTSRTRPARPSGPTSADGGSTFSGISAAPSATRRKTTEASRPRPAWGDPPGARPSRTRVTGPARASADAGARAPSRAGGAGRSSDSGAPRFTNAVATGPKSAVRNPTLITTMNCSILHCDVDSRTVLHISAQFQSTHTLVCYDLSEV